MECRRIEDAAKALALQLTTATVADGGLISHAANLTWAFGNAALYVVRILSGAKPADLPIEQPTRFELIVNMKIAKALGITIPNSLLARADEVIQ